MKKKFKILSYAFFIITLLVFIGCQVDDTILETKSNTENTKGYSVRKISISEMQNNEKLKIPLESLSKTFDVNKVIKNNNITQNANSKIYSNDGNITLLTDNILETSTDSSATYTFILETPTDFESDFENFVVEIKNNDEYNFYLLKYKLNNNSIDFPYSTTIQTVSNNSFNIDDFNNQINGKVQAIYSDGCTFIFVESGCSCDGSSSWTLIDYWCGGGGSGGGGSSGSGGSGSGGFGGGSGGGYGGGSGGGGSNTGSGSNNGNSGGPTSPISVIESAETQAQIKREKAFKLQLNWTQSPWLNNNEEAENSIYTYLESQVTDPLATEYSIESVQFAEELIDLAILEPNQEDVYNIINLTILFETNEENIFEDDFIESLDPYIDLGFPPSTFNPNMLSIKVFLKYKNLRILNPTWSRSKCLWEATKDIVHISLDAFGLIPVGGEIADITNGVLYTIEGDGLNASLSYANAVPIYGWATFGVKYAIKINEVSTIATKVKLVWKVGTDGVIQFGTSGQLRKSLGLIPGNPQQAHHIVPWSSRTKMAVQRAAKSGSAFHMNEALNGIPVAAWRNQPNHQTYNNVINAKLDAFRDLNPNATPQECYNFLTDLIQDIRNWVINNPTLHLNEIVLP